MLLRAVVLALVLPVAVARAAVAQPARPTDPGLERGIAQVREGDFASAVMTLDELARRLAEKDDQPRVLARTYVYLSVAYLGLSQVEAARAKFLEALDTDDRIELTPSEFPPRFLAFFEETMKERDTTAATSPQGAGTGGTPPPSSAQEEGASPAPDASAATAAGSEKKGRSKALLAVLGAGAGVGAAVALAGGGGGDSSTPTPPPSPPSASVTSPQNGALVNCTQDVYVVVTVTNPRPNALSVTGIVNSSEATSGNCTASPDFTYTSLVSSVEPRSSARVLNRGLYGANGCGCCNGECTGAACGFRDTFTVLTGAGELSAGTIEYSIQFSGCAPCAAGFGAPLRAQSQAPTPGRHPF
jgi:hypothetical protein